MPEMITVRCPQCGKKLQFSPFDNYLKASLECPGCHYTGLVETYPDISGASQSHSQAPNSSNGAGVASNRPSSSVSEQRSRNPRGQNNNSIRDLDSAPAARSSRAQSSSTASTEGEDQPTGFALKFPWVISGLALAIIILYICLQCISTNEVI